MEVGLILECLKNIEGQQFSNYSAQEAREFLKMFESEKKE